MTLGLREVATKRRRWRERNLSDLEPFLGSHMIPVIAGPGNKQFVIDHHHLARALHEEGLERVFVTVVADMHELDESTFWNMMDFHGWTHPFDAEGRRRDYRDLPKTVEDMEDDPYRSLAGALRNIGGFAKDSTPYSEFVWADFFRKRIKLKSIHRDFEAALREAQEMARSEAASYLPGWCAAHEADAAEAAKVDSEVKKKKAK